MALLLLLVVAALPSSGVASVDRISDVYATERPRAPLDVAFDKLSALVKNAAGVQLAEAGHLEVTGDDGGVTAVAARDGVLRVIRPDGGVDDLLEGVESVDFELHETRMLREAEPLVDHGTIWAADSPAGVSQAVLLEAGRQLALSFVPRAVAPETCVRIDGIDEGLIEATLGEMSWRVGRIDGHGKEFCHLRDEAPHKGAHADGAGVLTFDLYEARAPGDARPSGGLLATHSIPVSSLPEASYNWYDRSIGEEVIPPEILDPRSGAAWAWWAARPEVVLNVAPTLEQVDVDLSPLQAVVVPGRAYTLLVGMAGDDLLAVEAVEGGETVTSGVAMKSARNSLWERQAFAVWRRLQGQRTFSQTAEVHVPWRVDLHLDYVNRSSRDIAIDIRAVGADRDGPAPRLPLIQLPGAGRVAAIDQRVESLLSGAAEVPRTHVTGSTLLQGVELVGLVVLEQGAVLYLDDVVLRGSIVSRDPTAAGGAPRVIVEGPLSIIANDVLPGTAIYLPGGQVRTTLGSAPALQVDGDLIAGEIDLDAHGLIQGQVATVAQARLGAGLMQPKMQRARLLHAPGLDR